MDRSLISGRFMAAVVSAGLTIPVPVTSANDTPQIEPLEQVQPDEWAGVPAEFFLTGQIIDDEGNPVWRATVFSHTESGETELAKSGGGGIFEISEALSPSTRLVIRHKMIAPRYVKAGTLYNGEGSPVVVEIFPYTERFDVTPEGGTFQSGELTLEVPEGALVEPVTILAAQLPLDYAYNNDGSPEPLRLTSVDLKPHGLTFAKPVTLTMTIAREDMDKIGDPISLYYDEDKDRYIHDPTATVEIIGHRASLTLSHFSPHAVADRSIARSMQHLGRGSDVDSDGSLTPSDALFMLLTSGGSQTASASYAQTVAGDVRSARSSPLPRAAAREIAEKFSLGRSWEKTVRADIKVEANEYEFECKLLLGRYSFSHAAEWERVTPGIAEMELIQKEWDKADGRTEYFTWQGSRSLIIAPALPGRLTRPDTQTIAVSLTEDGPVIYAKRGSYRIARLLGSKVIPCSGDIEPALWASVDDAAKDARGYKAQRDAMKENFRFGGPARESQGILAWGTLSHDTLQVHTGMKCESDMRQIWNYSISWGEVNSSPGMQHNSTPHARIWTTPFLPTARTDNNLSTSVDWTVSNSHTRTYSEQLTAGLFRQTSDGPVPFGFLLHRIGERTCEAVLAPHKQNPGEPTVLEPKIAAPYGLASRSD